MPSRSTLHSDGKNKVKAAIPAASNKILFATLARIYYAHLDPNKWSYSGLQGALAIARDNSKKSYAFRLVDLDGTRGVIWDYELYNGLEYNPDRAFFHSFAADDCMIGFLFADEREAKAFWKKVTTKKEKPSAAKPASKKNNANKGGNIDNSKISGPASNEDAGFTSQGVDPSWIALLGQLENSGIDKQIIAQEIDFIKDFVRKHPQPAAKEPKKPKPPSRRTHATTDSSSSVSAPPPPPPPRELIPPPRQQQTASSVVNVTDGGEEESGSNPTGITHTRSAAPVIIWPTDLELPPPRPQRTASSSNVKDTARGEEQSGSNPKGTALEDSGIDKQTVAPNPSSTTPAAGKPRLKSR
ncbi:hypothetical protein DFH06DRAFT_1048151 [Mycena polygramma]|nr:hypothetical protein DFH06DRAFT_1048151 [Mycena polygramma]